MSTTPKPQDPGATLAALELVRLTVAKPIGGGWATRL